MFNSCYCRITAIGPDHDLARFHQSSFRTDQWGHANFSLDSFVPEPTILQEPEPTFETDLALVALGIDPIDPTSGAALTFEQVLRFEWVREAGIVSRADLLAHLETRRPEGLAAGRRRLAAFAETGFYDRRLWREANWGIVGSPQWSAVLLDKPGQFEFSFATEGVFPAPAFRVLGVLYPAITFHLVAVDIERRTATLGLVKGTSMSVRSSPYFDDRDGGDCDDDDRDGGAGDLQWPAAATVGHAT